MQGQSDLAVRCSAAVAALNDEFEWQLTATQQRAYCAALQHLLPDEAQPLMLRRVALNYHQDHALVEALTNSAQARHDDHWRAWMGQVVPILRHAGLDWSDDIAIDLDDLAQVARAELARALPGFRYASRFSTWSHQVVVQSVRRYLRDSRAQKRAGRPGSLEQTHAMRISEHESPEAIANGRVLATLIDDILSAHPDARLAIIFQRWAHADQRVEEIGRQLRLGPSQVRLLLSRIRDILQRDPSIRAWYEQAAGATPSDAPREP